MAFAWIENTEERDGHKQPYVEKLTAAGLASQSFIISTRWRNLKHLHV